MYDTGLGDRYRVHLRLVALCTGVSAGGLSGSRYGGGRLPTMSAPYLCPLVPVIQGLVSASRLGRMLSAPENAGACAVAIGINSGGLEWPGRYASMPQLESFGGPSLLTCGTCLWFLLRSGQ